MLEMFTDFVERVADNDEAVQPYVRVMRGESIKQYCASVIESQLSSYNNVCRFA